MKSYKIRLDVINYFLKICPVFHKKNLTSNNTSKSLKIIERGKSDEKCSFLERKIEKDK